MSSLCFLFLLVAVSFVFLLCFFLSVVFSFRFALLLLSLFFFSFFLLPFFFLYFSPSLPSFFAPSFSRLFLFGRRPRCLGARRGLRLLAVLSSLLLFFVAFFRSLLFFLRCLFSSSFSFFVFFPSPSLLSSFLSLLPAVLFFVSVLFFFSVAVSFRGVLSVGIGVLVVALVVVFVFVPFFLCVFFSSSFSLLPSCLFSLFSLSSPISPPRSYLRPLFVLLSHSRYFSPYHLVYTLFFHLLLASLHPHGKEGVIGSSPIEGFPRVAANPHSAPSRLRRGWAGRGTPAEHGLLQGTSNACAGGFLARCQEQPRRGAAGCARARSAPRR